MRRATTVFLAYAIGFSGWAFSACTWSSNKDSGGGTGGDVGTGGAPADDGGTGGASVDDGGTIGTGGNPGTGGTPGGTGGIVMPSDGGSPVDAPTCGMQSFMLEATPPDLLIVLDRSGSMTETPEGKQCAATMPACPATTKWPQITSAINEVVMMTESTIRWGLKVFPDTDACGTAAAPAVAVGDKSAAAIATAITMNPPPAPNDTAMRASTPTHQAVINAAAYLTALPDKNPKYILVATDGLPNCGGATNNPNTADEQGTIDAVKAAAASGIPVFVVGIATAMSNADTTLNAMAMAGGKPQAGATSYYPVASKGDLVTALGVIQGKITSCEFKLTKKPPFPDKVTVKGDGADIPKSTTAGWDYGTDQMSIILSGSYCDQVMAGQLKNVEAVFMCVIPDIP